MKSTRHFLAITLVAAALCADRAAAAAPALRPQVASVASRLVTRLSSTFRRVMPAARVYESARNGLQPQASTVLVTVVETSPDLNLRLSPLLLHLPPPTV